jgi:hypothetical protein
LHRAKHGAHRPLGIGQGHCSSAGGECLAGGQDHVQAEDSMNRSADRSMMSLPAAEIHLGVECVPELAADSDVRFAG